MLGQHLSWMPVCDEDRRVVGVLGRSDVLTVFAARRRVDPYRDHRRRTALDPPADPTRVLVEVDGGVVTLTGELDTRLDAQVAVRLIERVEGVVAVVDHLRFRTDERVADASATPMY